MIVRNSPKEQLIKQLNSFYSFNSEEKEIIEEIYPLVIDKMKENFRCIKNKYYHENGDELFDSLHVAQWTMFLYLMARESYRLFKGTLQDKIYGLSKIVSSADIFYGAELPEIWFFDHPQGTVLGRAIYSNYFSFSQGCTVGNNRGIYPTIGEHVTMFSDSKILGNCKIGDYVIFSANSYVIDQDIPTLSIVFGASPNVTVKRITKEKFNQLTSDIFY